MRLGLLIDAVSWESIRLEARLADRLGLPVALIPERGVDGAPRNACAIACALASHTEYLRIIVEVPAESHPVGLAEELAVTDLLLGGRTIAALSGADADTADEALSVIAAALAARPFRHGGARWVLPLGERALRVTPAPAQLELPLWLHGEALEGLARRRGLPWIAPRAADAVAADAEQDRGTRARVRPAIRAALLGGDGGLAVEETVAMLAQARAGGVDCAILELPAQLDLSGRAAAIELLGSRVAPRLELEELPEQLVSSWDRRDA